MDAVGIDLKLVELLAVDETEDCFEAKLEMTISWCKPLLWLH